MVQPEEHARQIIDRLLTAAGWQVCDPGDAHITAYRGVAIREFPLRSGHGFADYLFYFDGKAAESSANYKFTGARHVLFLVDRSNLGVCFHP
jgi:type I site-specific restriction endonuclease